MRIRVGHVVARVQIRLLPLEHFDVVELPFGGLDFGIEGIGLDARRGILASGLIRFRGRCRRVFGAGIGTHCVSLFGSRLSSLLGSLLSFGRRGLRGNDLVECQVGEIDGDQMVGHDASSRPRAGRCELAFIRTLANHVERSRKGIMLRFGLTLFGRHLLLDALLFRSDLGRVVKPRFFQVSRPRSGKHLGQKFFFGRTVRR